MQFKVNRHRVKAESHDSTNSHDGDPIAEFKNADNFARAVASFKPSS